MRVLVTGGAGFIGSHVCELLTRRGDSVVCLDDLSTGRVSNIEHLGAAGSFTFCAGSVLEPMIGIPVWQSGLVLMVAMTATNLFSVSSYGEFEYWFAGIKVGAIVVFLVIGVPLIYSLVLSLFRINMLTKRWIFVGLRNYLDVLPHPDFLAALARTAYFTGVTVTCGWCQNGCSDGRGSVRKTSSVAPAR